MGGGSEKSNNSNSSMSNSSGAGVNSGLSGGFNVNNSGNFGQTNSGNSGFNMSSGSSAGGSASSSKSTDNVWGAQTPFLESGYEGAQGAFDKAMAGIDGMTPQMTEQMKGIFDQGMSAMGNAGQGGFSAGLQGQVGPNAYTDALKGDIVSDAGKLKQQTLGSLDARAAAAGMSGSSGYRDQVADSFGEIDSNAQQQMNQLGFNAHNQGIQNQMGLANQMDNNANFALGQTGAMQNAAMNQAQPHMLGQQAASNYMGTIGGPTVLNNSSSVSSSSNSSNNNGFGMNNGFSNGMNMGFGNGFGGNFGVNSGANVNNSNSTGSGSGSSSGWNVAAPKLPVPAGG
jgi:hypothetical protein